MEVKHIDPAALATITTGFLMTDFDPVHEACEWLMGHPIFTMSLPHMAERLKAAALAQYPDLPVEVDGDWQQVRDEVRARFGETVVVTKGKGDA